MCTCINVTISVCIYAYIQLVPTPTPAPATIGLKIIVIDDDPTGSQTVHGCPLLLRWDPVTLDAALADPSPLLFLLAWRTAVGGLNAFATQTTTMMLGFPEWVVYAAMVPPLVLTGVIGIAQCLFGFEAEASA